MTTRTMASELAELGSLIADPTRAEILCALMDGRAHTGRELARHLGVADSTVSGHLSKLLDAGAVTVEAQGRHRYWRLSSGELAHLLETLGSHPITLDPPRCPASLQFARTCYDHLAGELAVFIHDALLEQGALRPIDSGLALTEHGYEVFERLGADVDAVRASRRVRARPCLDWSQRRHHLAGTAGAAMLDALLSRGWVERGERPRSIVVTRAGRAGLGAMFSLDLAA